MIIGCISDKPPRNKDPRRSWAERPVGDRIRAVRIIVPLAILLSVGWLLLVSVLVSRGGDNGARLSAAPGGDAAGLLRQSRAAMLELDSFQFEMTMQWEGRDITYRLVWQSPDSFYVLYPNAVAHYESGQETEITDYGLVEAIAVGDRIYSRQCAAEDEDCQPWGEGVRDGIYVPAFAGEALDPYWTVEVLGLMSDAQIVGQENVHGVACTRIRGKANVMQAMIQSWRRAEEIRGPMYWGEECTTIDSDAGAQDECHSLSLDEYIATNEHSLREQDKNPPSVEVWIGRDDKLMRRLEFTTVVAEPPAGSFTFSQFNEVTVEPPK